MDLSLRDALDGVGRGRGGGVPGGAPGEGLLKRDVVATLEKESYDDKVGEKVTKSDFRPLLDGKDTKSGGRQDPSGQPAFSSDYLSGPKTTMGGMADQWSQNKTKDSSMPDSLLGFSQSGMGGTNLGMGSGLSPFQTSMSSSLGQSVTGSAMDSHKSFGLFGSEPKTTSNTSGSTPFKPSDPFSSGGPGLHSVDHSTVKSDNKDKQQKTDNMSNKPEKSNTFDKSEKEEQQKKDSAQDKTQTTEKIPKDEEKVENTNAGKDNKTIEKEEKADRKEAKASKPEKDDKNGKKEEEKKGEREEKGGKATAKSPTTNGSKNLASPDGKSKPAVGSTKPNSRPSTLSTNGEASSAKRPSPATANQKSPVTKVTTPTATKRSPAATGSAKAAKTPESGTAEKRPLVPKATAYKAGSAANTASKTTANKNDKTENKTGEAKKLSTPKTTASRPRPASTTPTPSAATPNDDGPITHRRRTITKPPVPKQTPMEKKPAIPRAPRTPRPINAPTPDLSNVRSKIGSIDNMKYQPGGGKLSSTQNSKTSDPSTPAAKARVQIVHKKLDFSHVTSRCGSKDNIKHVPGGGNVQILNKKVDLSKVMSKCGSKDNIKYKPGGGDVKIDSHKINVKAKSKVGSLDNVGLETGNGHANGHKEEKAEGKATSPPSGAPTTGPANVATATAAGSVTKENGVNEPTPSPFGADGLREPLNTDKRITETK